MDDTPEPTAAVCHDAGAANIVIEAIRAAPTGRRFVVYFQGPALEIWRSNPVARVVVAGSLDEVLATARFLVTGTGWASTLEHDARALAQLRGIPQAAVIDHWVNYPERFVRRGVRILPDELWVTDSYACAEVLRALPGVPVRRVQNFYLMHTLAEISPTPTKQHVLYVLEPLRYTWPGLAQPGEFEALDFFVRNLAMLGLRGAPIRLRPHPSDPVNKYDVWLRKNVGAGVELDTSPTLAAALSWASWAAGCETMALAIALDAGRRVVSTMPPGAPHCRLPHAGIVHLRELTGSS